MLGNTPFMLSLSASLYFGIIPLIVYLCIHHLVHKRACINVFYEIS